MGKKRIHRQASYRYGVRWIALNDETLEMDPDVVESFISVQLLADLFGADAEDVARDVVRYRRKHMKEAWT